MAEITDSTPTSATRADFDRALCEANTITSIIERLADYSISGSVMPAPGHFIWLADELILRLERLELADQTMRAARA